MLIHSAAEESLTVAQELAMLFVDVNSDHVLEGKTELSFTFTESHSLGFSHRRCRHSSP